VLRFGCCELLLLKASSFGRGEFGKPEEEEHLESCYQAMTMKMLLRTHLRGVCVCVSVWVGGGVVCV
jgi:hypothetical protein